MISSMSPKIANESLEQAKLLLDYTKFHIGLYTTLAAAFVALLASKFAERWSISRPLVVIALLAVVLAGGAGGVIGSSLPHYVSSSDLWAEKEGPWWMPVPLRLSIGQWANVEHTAFWIASVAMVLAVVPSALKRRNPMKEPPKEVLVAGEIMVKKSKAG